MKIESSRRGQLPKVDPPTSFQAGKGRIRGWRVAVPGQKPLATPAVRNGRVFLGGGFGSYEFYCFDAVTGQVVWQYQTEDDGPTSAVVDDQFVCFNTESCELEVLTLDGERVWKKWLGDPLMSMPAMAAGRVYMAYPDSRSGGQHYLACFDAANGTEIWRSPISGEIITAPTIADGKVYLSSLDGTLYCFDATNGRENWKESKNATSSPVVANGQCYFSRWDMKDEGPGQKQKREYCAQRGVEPVSPTRAFAGTATVAHHLDHAKRMRGSPYYKMQAAADSAVGFAAFKGSAKIEQAMHNLGRAHVAGVWSYQGSKPFVSSGRLYSAVGATLYCVKLDSEDVLWSRKVASRDRNTAELENYLTPPAIVNGKVFVGNLDGAVLCLAADSGEPIWQIDLDEPVVFQPSVADGRIMVATNSGALYILQTDDDADRGWNMWGATACHNGPEAPGTKAS